MPDHSLDCWATQLFNAVSTAAANRANETELREDAELVLRPAVRDLYHLDDIHITAERPAGRQAPGGVRRPYDKAYGGVVIEWEWAMRTPAARDHAASQALDYLALMRANLGRDDAFTAVVTDGNEWAFLVIDPPADSLDLFGEAAVSAAERFQWTPNTVEACRRFLQLVGSNAQSPITASGLAAAFGPGNDTVRRMVAILGETLRARTADDRPDTLYQEWRRLLDVVYGDLDAVSGELAEEIAIAYDLERTLSVGELMFAVHTYFALIARLLAIEVLAISAGDQQSRPTNWVALPGADLQRKLEQLDAGEIPTGLSISNLFEGDLFSWFLDESARNIDLSNAIRGLLSTMTGFAFPRVAFGGNHAQDLLRDLYQVLVPRRLRSALGEFLTPIWLAESCLERLSTLAGNRLRDGRVLDPTCGTGTFLIPILRSRISSLRRLRGGSVSLEDVRNLVNGIVGFDINPVAVVAARVNYLIALGDLTALGPITIPVYQADSILVPDAPVRQGSVEVAAWARTDYREVRTSLSQPFPIPQILATLERTPTLRRLLEEAMQEDDAAESRDLFTAGLTRSFGPGSSDVVADNDAQWRDVLAVAEELHARVRRLRDEGRNGVWARIIENAFAPLFSGQFDIAVGNPPWLTWMRLPERWRRAAEPYWRKYGLWQVPREDGRRPFSLASTDLAVLVFAVTMERYVARDGLLGLLTPDSLVRADPSGRAFRQFRLREENAEVYAGGIDLPFRIVHLDDWSSVGPFSPDAANRPIFLIAQRGETHQFPVPTTRWERMTLGQRLRGDWVAVRPRLSPIAGTSFPVDRDITTSAWSFQPADAPPLLEGGSNGWQFGVGLHTRGANGIFIVRIHGANRPRHRLDIENIPAEGHNREVVQRRGWVESELVHPLLRGRDVSHWVARPGSYIILPYDPADLGSYLGEERLRGYPDAHAWLRANRDVLIGRAAPPNRSWDIAGDDWCRLEGSIGYMTQPHIVVVRELQRRPAAAVIQRRFDAALGRIAAPLIDQKLVFCSVGSQEEAIYLAAFVNSTPMQDLLASFGSHLAISPLTLGRLPIPPFQPGDTVTRLVEEGRGVVEADDPAAEAVARRERLDELVLMLLGCNTDDYRPQPSRRPSPRTRRRRNEAPMGEPLF